MAERDKEMLAIIIVSVLVALGVALAAQPVSTPAVAHMTAVALSLEPAWMVLSGVALIAVAGVLRRRVR